MTIEPLARHPVDPSVGDADRVVVARSAAGGLALAVTASDGRDAGSKGGIDVPRGLAAEVAILAPRLALALSVWEDLRLELGETAVVAGGGAFGDLVARVGVLRGALPMVRLEGSDESDPRLLQIPLKTDEPEEASARIRSLFGRAPGCAAVDLTGRAEVADLLLEALPRFGRFMLAGRTGLPLTLDYYTNIHRKGVQLMARDLVLPDVLEEGLEEPWAGRLRRAFRILADPGTFASVAGAAETR